MRLLMIGSVFLLAACGSGSAPGAQTSAPEPALPTGADLMEIYTHLHANPELSFQESETSTLLAAEIEALGFAVTTDIGDTWVREKATRDVGEVYQGVGGYGVVGVMENGEGPTLLIRADMDALPVTERTGLDFASTATGTTWTGVDGGIMHACAHDIHMTSWVGAARALVERKDEWSGTLVMILQPAEELGLGAQAMLSDGLFERFPTPDANLALHVSASLPSNQIGYASGFALANVDTVDISVKGIGGHGAYPHTTRDPVVVAAHIVTALQTLVSRSIDPQSPAVVTVGSITAGTKHNIISDEATLLLTVRSYDDETRQALLDGIVRIAEGQAASFGAPAPTVTIESDYLPATYNDPAFTEASISAISASLGEERVVRVDPVMGGEDFSQYGRTDDNIPSLIFWVGGVDPETHASAQEGALALPSLHSPFFAPDAAASIETGTAAMTAAALSFFQTGEARPDPAQEPAQAPASAAPDASPEASPATEPAGTEEPVESPETGSVDEDA